MLRVIHCWKKSSCLNRNISICSLLLKENNTEQPVSKRKVKETVELIMLVDQNDKILGLKPKPEAEKLALKLNLSLQRVTDPKYGKLHPAYKMFSLADLLKTEIKSSTAKVLKKLPLNSRITDHDLLQKLNIIRKWLNKKCEVHIAIARNNEAQAKMKAVSDKIREEFKNESRVVNIREKEEAIKFILLPPKEDKNVSNSKDNNEKVIEANEQDNAVK